MIDKNLRETRTNWNMLSISMHMTERNSIAKKMRRRILIWTIIIPSCVFEIIMGGIVILKRKYWTEKKIAVVSNVHQNYMELRATVNK